MSARVLKVRTIHDGWAKFRIAQIALADGQVIAREIEDHGRAVAVLPYDPARRVVMLVKQLRAPMLVAAGLQQSLEAPAGILDSEDPMECARRETMEECGLRLGRGRTGRARLVDARRFDGNDGSFSRALCDRRSRRLRRRTGRGA